MFNLKAGSYRTGVMQAMLVLSSCVLVACGGDVPPAPVSVAPTPPAAISTVVTISVLDSSTGNLLTGATTTLTFGGTGAGSLRSLDGAAVTSVTTTTGVAQVQLASGTTPSDASPLSFTVTAARAGNITVTEQARLVSTTSSNVEVRMLPLQTTAGAVANLPTAAAAGNVTVATSTTAGSLPANSGGNFVAAATLPATQTQTAAVQATVAVPPTVTAFVNGTTTPAATGSVAAQIVVVDPKATTAAAVLPPTVVTAPASGTAPATVDTVANVAKIVLTDSAGNAINRFSSPITLSLDIPATVLNPATGAAFAVGATIPISTYNEATGSWVRKNLLNGTPIVGTVTAIDAATGNRKVSFQTDSLSWFAVMVPTTACNTTDFALTPAAASTTERRFKASLSVRTATGAAGTPQELSNDVVIPANSTAAVTVGPFTTTSVANSTATLTLTPVGGGDAQTISTTVCTRGSANVASAATSSIQVQLTATYNLAANSVGSATCPITRVEAAVITVVVNSRVFSAPSPATGFLTLSNLPPGQATISASQGSNATGISPAQVVQLTPNPQSPIPVAFTATRTCGTVSGGG